MVKFRFDPISRAPNRQFHLRRTPKRVNSALYETVPSCCKKRDFKFMPHFNKSQCERQVWCDAYPIFGPPCVKSNTWRGFKSHWNFWSNFAPWLPPLFGFMKTNTGVMLGFGMGFITKVLFSLSFDFFLPADFFFGGFLNDDLKLPFRGNLTIHDGGTIIREWIPKFFVGEGGGTRKKSEINEGVIKMVSSSSSSS